MIQYQGEIESILYTLGDEGISLKNLAAILGIHVSALRQLLAELTEFYESHDGGLTLIHHHDTYQLATKPKFAPILHQYFSEHQPTSLSQAALETMAIVAYKQPVTRIEIDQIRGVHSSGALQTLVARQMIQETGRKEVAGRPILYGTTDYFLNYFGLDSLDELPELTEFNAGQYDASGNLDLFFKDRQPETTEEEELIDETDTD
ncbi:segregation and condensation protein B [Lapidilactobacillus dextrinicus DSM 20335]|uniref:Segregation and condensation protein B n=1 Tax=Lapidilactobacillus dextrinicus DSM 20335 TaxID=1423738 RepID=A0A0R2BIW5_9LACO|nr:SMC-Scp complex subunit ScpB [Lapidilactobacillus dextrinicus]KRM79178.1 segregation and condensation protein B [Lapidilactobacillus dextrinicus DSM 20335]